MTIPLLFSLAVGLALAPAKPLELRVSMVALGVENQARSIKFYAETLGLEMVGKPGEVTLFRAGQISIALNSPLGRASGTPMAGAVEIIFPVASVAHSYEQLAARGCTFIHHPREVFSGTWAATFTDPDGHKLTILGPH